MKILALDYGRRRIGVALLQDGEMFALPPLEISSKFEVKEKIEKLIQEYPPDLIILGKPPSGHIQGDVERLSQILNEWGVAVQFLDEGLTTVQAEHELYLEGIKGKHKKGFVDSVSAISLLQAYLDKDYISK